MQIYRNGSSSITDDDENYLTSDDDENNGIFNLQVNSAEIHDLLYKTIKQIPDFYDTELFKRLAGIHTGNYNIGFCCLNEFRSNTKTTVCPSCGKIVSLT